MTTEAAIQVFVLTACGRAFVIRCLDADTAALVVTAFSGLRTSGPTPAIASRRYDVARASSGEGFTVSDGVVSQTFGTADALLFHIDKDITLTLQRERPDLFFLHSGVVSVDGQAVALLASSGTGKSTLTLACAADGFGYSSDELAPVDLQHLTVEPYPHAVYLKNRPPAPYVLPADTRQHDGRFYVPVESLPGPVSHGPLPLAACVFVRRAGDEAELWPLSRASAAARLMEHALNQLAHPADGLDAAVTIVKNVPSFDLDSSDLPAASRSLRALLDAVAAGRQDRVATGARS